MHKVPYYISWVFLILAFGAEDQAVGVAIVSALFMIAAAIAYRKD